MKRFFVAAIPFVLFAGCATSPGEPEGARATEAMTDMDGRPISPGPAANVGISIGIGRWGGRTGGGVGIGVGF